MLFAGDTFAIKWHGIARAAIIAAKLVQDLSAGNISR